MDTDEAELASLFHATHGLSENLKQRVEASTKQVMTG